MHKSALNILLIIFIAVLSCKNESYTETEPNNDFLTDNTIKINSSVKGHLESIKDHDFFVLNITSPEVIDIELKPVKGLNHAIKIWKDSRTLLKYIDDSRKSSPERMCNMSFDTGVYYIEILHGDRLETSENVYEFVLKARSRDNEEYESNDTYTDASFLEPESDVKGYFSPAFNKALNESGREEDWFNMDIDLPEENPMLLDVSITGVPDVNSRITICNSQRDEIASIDNQPVGEGESLEGIGILEPGRYYIVISSNFESNNTIPYILYSRLKAYDHSTELEPNNTFEEANSMENNEITGRLFPADDKDYFIYSPYPDDFSSETYMQLSNNSESLKSFNRIEAISNELDIVLKIYDRYRRSEVFIIDNVKGAGRELFPNVYLKDGFYLEISAKEGNTSETGYKLNISSYPLSDEYEIEPNDSKETANNVFAGRITGFISKKDDRDFYLLKYRNRVKKKFTIQGIRDADLKISITDPWGSTFKSDEIKGNESVSFTEMIEMKGYLIIESDSENFEDSYNITIED